MTAIGVMFGGLGALGILAVCATGVALWALYRNHDGTPFPLEISHEKRLPIRGDAQRRDVRVRASDSRPAARADLTGSLSPRPLDKDPWPVSAPPARPSPRALYDEAAWDEYTAAGVR